MPMVEGNWIPVALNVKDTSLELDTEMMRSGTDIQFRVEASDGLHRAFAVTPKLTINAKPPTLSVQMQSPATLSPDSTLWIRATTMSTRRMEWSGAFLWPVIYYYSDRDGPIGSGEELMYTRLSLGVHHIRVVAIDEDGSRAAEHLTVTVQ